MSRWRDIKQGNKTDSIEKEEVIQDESSSSASLGKRIKAFLTDSFLITTPIIYIVMYLVLGGGSGFAENRALGWGLILSIILFVIVFFWYIKYQTPGMKAYGLKIIKASNEERISLGQAIIRYLATLFAMASFFLMFLPFFNKDKKTFQDLISNTIIINE